MTSRRSSGSIRADSAVDTDQVGEHHRLVQDAAYGTLLREPRRALHARIAETLDKLPEITGDQPELLARHCTGAGLIEKAVGLWAKAAHRSQARSEAGRSTEAEANVKQQQSQTLLAQQEYDRAAYLVQKDFKRKCWISDSSSSTAPRPRSAPPICGSSHSSMRSTPGLLMSSSIASIADNTLVAPPEGPHSIASPMSARCCPPAAMSF